MMFVMCFAAFIVVSNAVFETTDELQCNEDNECETVFGPNYYCRWGECEEPCDLGNNCYPEMGETCNNVTRQCEFEDCGNRGGDSWCQSEFDIEYICVYRWNQYDCIPKPCNDTNECETEFGPDYSCVVGECGIPCSDDNNSSCSYGQVCNDLTGACEYESCGNQGGDAYCQNQYGSGYVCRFRYGNYWCDQAPCNDTSDCTSRLGDGYYCDESRYECRESCDPNAIDTTCDSDEICNDVTLECEYETCGNSYDDEYCPATYGPEYVCQQNVDNPSDAYCRPMTCDTTADCVPLLGNDYYCTDDWPEGECRQSCWSTHTNSTCDSYEICSDITGKCVQKNCGNQGGDSYCWSKGFGPEYICYQSRWDPDTAWCQQKICNLTSECSAIDSSFVCAYGECQEGCFGNHTLCQYEDGYYNSEYICTSEGVCGRQQCEDDVDCPSGSECRPWNSYTTIGYCEGECSGDNDCYEKYGDSSYFCNADTLLCEFGCADTAVCQNNFYDNYECNNGQCERIPWCIWNDDTCDSYESQYGVEYFCNVTSENCEEVTCVTDANCTTAPYTTCLSPYELYGIDEPGECINPCTSDQECIDRNFDNTNYYCILGLGICDYGRECQTVSDCYDGDVCDNGVCKQFYCESDDECVDHTGIAFATCNEYGQCKYNECLVDSDCTDPENACFTYNTVPWGNNTCFTSCTDDNDCSGTDPDGDAFTCEFLKTGAIAENIPPKDINICTNETLPTLVPSVSPTEKPTDDGTSQDEADNANVYRVMIGMGFGFYVVIYQGI